MLTFLVGSSSVPNMVEDPASPPDTQMANREWGPPTPISPCNDWEGGRKSLSFHYSAYYYRPLILACYHRHISSSHMTYIFETYIFETYIFETYDVYISSSHMTSIFETCYRKDVVRDTWIQSLLTRNVCLKAFPISKRYLTLACPSFYILWVQSRIVSYQKLEKCCLIPPCLTLNNIRYVSRVKWSNSRERSSALPYISV